LVNGRYQVRTNARSGRLPGSYKGLASGLCDPTPAIDGAEGFTVVDLLLFLY
jgi:hypothetical protein